MTMIRSTLLGAALAVGMAGAAQAAVITYFDVDNGVAPNAPFPQSAASAANFVGAAGPLSLLTFEGVAAGTLASFSPAAGVTLSRTGPDYGGGFTGTNNTQIGTAVWGFNTTAGGNSWFGAPDGTMTFAFDTPITAWGAFLTGMEASLGGSILASFDNGAPQLVAILSNSLGGVEFVGFISDTSFSSITLSKTSGGDGWGIDDVYYSSQNAMSTPEPASAVLLAAGLIGLAARRRRAG
jgi:hypothetical protein